MPSTLKTAYEKSKVIGPLYTSGPVAVTPDGAKIFTCVSEEILYTDINTGEEIHRFTGDGSDVTALCLTPSVSHLLVFGASHALRIYSNLSTISNASPPQNRTIAKAHDAPVYVCKSDPTSTYLASGSADGVVKVWDIVRGYTTHVFKGHGGVVSALAFHCPLQDESVFVQNTARKLQLITASVDTRIRIFDLNATAARQTGGAKPQAVLEGHVSVPRGLDVSPDGKWLVSGGRDSVVLVWDLEPTASSTKRKGKEKAIEPILVKTIPILEQVEAVGLLRLDERVGESSSGSLRFYTAGDKGNVKIWDGRTGVVISSLGETLDGDDPEESRRITEAIYLPQQSTILSVHADQNLLFHSLSDGSLSRQIVGFNDEIVDLTYLSPDGVTDSHIAVATNSSLIRLYSSSGLDARLLSGHTNIVLCLDSSADGRILASGSKDNAARIWASDTSGAVACVAICEGHAESVGAIALSRKHEDDQLRFMVTGGQDRTIKLWDLSSAPTVHTGAEAVKCKSLTTQKAHDKDINALDVSPNDRLLASGSQDRTAKVYEIDYTKTANGVRGDLRLLGTCKGHKRGVWTVRFSKAERVLATGSGDKTIKLWNLEDFTCVKTFEGHTNSVLRLDFLNSGMQMVSAASDGLVKLWNVKDEECVATMDNHEDKIWALAVSSDESTVVSGAADSVITFWQDRTEEQEVEKEAQRTQAVMKEQDFLNYVNMKDYRRAIELALAMEQPGRLYNMFSAIRERLNDDGNDSMTGEKSVDLVLQSLGGRDLARLLGYVRDWNAKTKTSAVAQGVLFAIFSSKASEDVAVAFNDANGGGTALKEMVDALIPYTERHLARMQKLVQESFVVDFVLHEMDDGMFEDDDMQLDNGTPVIVV